MVSNPHPIVRYTVLCAFVIDLGYQRIPLIIERRKGIRIGKGKSGSRVRKDKSWSGGGTRAELASETRVLLTRLSN